MIASYIPLRVLALAIAAAWLLGLGLLLVSFRLRKRWLLLLLPAAPLLLAASVALFARPGSHTTVTSWMTGPQSPGELHIEFPHTWRYEPKTIDWNEKSQRERHSARAKVAKKKHELRSKAIARAAEMSRAHTAPQPPPTPTVSIVRDPQTGHVVSVNVSDTGFRSRFGGHSSRWVEMVLGALLIGTFLCVGYVFLDSSTRGQFTWPLRIASLVAFGAICIALSTLRNSM